jgi:ribosomal protein L11 methyltransferase
MVTTSQLWRTQIRVNYQAADTVVQFLEDMGMQAVGWWECEDALPSGQLDDQGFPIAEEFHVEGYSKTVPSHELISQGLEALLTLLGFSMTAIAIESVDNADWLSVCYQQLEPRQLGRYYVYGSHNPGPVDSNLIALKIDAATAFGSGEHPTTSGCLQALDDLAKNNQFKNMLDMGCGSGILGIAMAKTWNGGYVLAVDNDPESVRVTEQNAILNGCNDNLIALVSEGFSDSRVKQAGPFEIITANILAKPLCMMAPDMKMSLAPQGYVVLSGLLDRQKEMVLKACEAEGLHLIKIHPIDDWVTLVLQRQ